MVSNPHSHPTVGRKAFPTYAQLSRAALAHNLACVRSNAPGTNVVAMIKSNAYGHGMLEMADELAALGITSFGVATLSEGVTLRRHGCKGEIILFGGASWLAQADALLKYELTPIITHLEELETLRSVARSSYCRPPVQPLHRRYRRRAYRTPALPSPGRYRSPRACPRPRPEVRRASQEYPA